jgi:hypothetical protein
MVSADGGQSLSELGQWWKREFGRHRLPYLKKKEAWRFNQIVRK